MLRAQLCYSEYKKYFKIIWKVTNMAVALETLYSEIDPSHHVKLLTKSCFHKRIDWMHMVEDMDFVPFLHGDELVFNSGINYVSNEWLRVYIDAIYEKHAGGLILSMRDEMKISQEIIDYCNELELPLFSARWSTPFIDIMRVFSGILLKNEQRETNLSAALRNAIYYPDKEELYRSEFERNGLLQHMNYTIAILSCDAYGTGEGNVILHRIQKGIRGMLKTGIVCEEQERLIILVVGNTENEVIEASRRMCQEDENIYMGIGTTVQNMNEISKSYQRAATAYKLTKHSIPQNVISYSELGIYKILTDQKEEEIYPEFVEETLGNLIKYDQENDTDYLKILMAYFENECSIINTARSLYCHKNTMTYKINKIKEILGYEILDNENRMKIMIAIYIMKLGNFDRTKE